MVSGQVSLWSDSPATGERHADGDPAEDVHPANRVHIHLTDLSPNKKPSLRAHSPALLCLCLISLGGVSSALRTFPIHAQNPSALNCGV